MTLHVVFFCHHEKKQLVGVFDCSEAVEEAIDQYIIQYKQKRRESVLIKLQASSQQLQEHNANSFVQTMYRGFQDDLREMDQHTYDYFQLQKDQRVRDKFVVEPCNLNEIQRSQ